MTTSPRAAARAGRSRIGLNARLDRLSDGRFAAVLAAPGLFLIGLFVVPPVLAVLALSLFRVELSFDSAPYHTGKAITLTALLIAAAWWFVGALLERRSRV